jgi:hypothetical protein
VSDQEEVDIGESPGKPPDLQADEDGQMRFDIGE